MRFQISKYFFKFLHTYFVTDNITNMKFWDLISADFDNIKLEKNPSRKQALQTIFHAKDQSVTLYILYVCDIDKNTLKYHYNANTPDLIYLMKNIMQNFCLPNLTSKPFKFDQIFKIEPKPDTKYNLSNFKSDDRNSITLDKNSDKGINYHFY